MGVTYTATTLPATYETDKRLELKDTDTGWMDGNSHVFAHIQASSCTLSSSSQVFRPLDPKCVFNALLHVRVVDASMEQR